MMFELLISSPNLVQQLWVRHSTRYSDDKNEDRVRWGRPGFRKIQQRREINESQEPREPRILWNPLGVPGLLD